jgi:FdhD protein
VSLRAGVTRASGDWLADEVPIALVFNGVSHAVMLASPADLGDFALGFALSEGLIASPADLYDVDVDVEAAASHGIEVRMEVSSEAFWALKARRRALAGRTGCGLCGVDSLAAVRRELPAAPVVQVAPGALGRAQAGLRRWQALQQVTGAAHAAAWCALDGDILVAREDIGRHNALDKLIGALARARLPMDGGFLCITSRASFEMVQKSAMAGAGMLAAVSAPTALAVAAARDCGLALAGFARGDDFVAYTHPERFGLLRTPADGD